MSEGWNQVMHDPSKQAVSRLSRKAQEFRIKVLEMNYGSQSGHIGGSFSAAEIIIVLLFHHLRLNPKNPGLAIT